MSENTEGATEAGTEVAFDELWMEVAINRKKIEREGGLESKVG